MRYLIILCLFTNILQCQNSQIKIVDSENGQNIENVLIFNNGNLLGASNNIGIAKIALEKGTVELVKEGYLDKTFVLTKEPLSVASLTKNVTIQLNDVVVKTPNNKSLLDSIYSKIGDKKLYKFPDYFHNYNLLHCDKDTLHYINERFYFDEKVGFYVDIQNRFVKNFNMIAVLKPKNTVQLVYKINNRQMAFPKNLNSGYIRINYYQEFKDLYNSIENYDLKLVSVENYYKLIFKPKNSNSKFSYQGYIVFDNNDYGILEFKMELLYNAKNSLRCNILNDKIGFEYLLKKEIYNIFYTKKGTQYYFTNSSNYLELLQLNGNNKNKIFVKNSFFEETRPFNMVNKRKLDIYSFEFL